MAAENWSQPISKTFEQIVYFSTSVTGYQTKQIWSKIVSISSFYVKFVNFSICEKFYSKISLFK
jgi:hypothetical protein